MATNFVGNSTCSSGVARNFRQGVRQSVAFLSVNSRSAAPPSRPYNQKKTSRHIIPTAWMIERTVINSYITKSHTKKLCIFLPGSAYAPYATCMATPLTPSRPTHLGRRRGPALSSKSGQRHVDSRWRRLHTDLFWHKFEVSRQSQQRLSVWCRRVGVKIPPKSVA